MTEGILLFEDNYIQRGMFRKKGLFCSKKMARKPSNNCNCNLYDAGDDIIKYNCGDYIGCIYTLLLELMR